MCLTMETTATDSGGFPSLFFFHALVPLPEQPIRVLSLTSVPPLILYVESEKPPKSANAAVHTTLRRATDSLTALTSPGPQLCVGALSPYHSCITVILHVCYDTSHFSIVH